MSAFALVRAVLAEASGVLAMAQAPLRCISWHGCASGVLLQPDFLHRKRIRGDFLHRKLAGGNGPYTARPSAA